MLQGTLFEMRRWALMAGVLCAAVAAGPSARPACADDLSQPTTSRHFEHLRSADVLAQLPADAAPTPSDQVDVGFVPITDLSVNIVPKTHDNQGRPLMAMPDPATDYYAAAMHGVTPIEQVRMWGLLEYQWEAAAFCYNPLYFEEVNAERYGNTFGCWQPWVSGVHFYASVGLLPLKLIIEPPHDCVYPLGHYRPGRCVPFEWHCNAVGKLRGCCR